MSSAVARSVSATVDSAPPGALSASPTAAATDSATAAPSSRSAAILELRRRLSAQAPASQTPPPLSTALPSLDAALHGGLPRGKLVELAGGAGKQSFTLLALAAATQRGEACAFIDVDDGLDVQTAARIGVALEQVLWVRPRGLKSDPKSDPTCAPKSEPAQASAEVTPPRESTPEERIRDGLKALDLVLAAGGFGLVVLSLGSLATQSKGAGRLCSGSATWSRLLQRAEAAGTALLLLSEEAVSGSAAVATLRCAPGEAIWQRVPGGRWLLSGQRTAIEVTRSRLAAPGDSIDLRLQR